MRPIVVVLGTLLVILGLIFMVVGIPGVANGGTESVTPVEYLVLSPTGTYSLGSTLNLTIAWSSESSSAVTVAVFPCGTDSSCSTVGGTPIARGTGLTGQVSFTATKGDYYAVGVSSAAKISYTARAGLGGLFFWVAAVFLAFGALLVLMGLLLKKRARPRTQTGKSTTDGPSSGEATVSGTAVSSSPAAEPPGASATVDVPKGPG